MVRATSYIKKKKNKKEKKTLKSRVAFNFPQTFRKGSFFSFECILCIDWGGWAYMHVPTQIRAGRDLQCG